MCNRLDFDRTWFRTAFDSSRFKITEPCGVDEFMYFFEGSVAPTSCDWHVQVIDAGEAVTIPKEWTGVWNMQDCIKIWAIYSEDGFGLD